jgi:purine nucleoside permease
MRSLHFSHLLLAAAASLVSATPLAEQHGLSKRAAPIAPKVFIIDMFEPEGAVWWGIPEFDVLAQNITVPGLSPLFPEIHCTANGDVCQIITGESEINAASSISALVLSSEFDLTKTYFFVAGIAGVNPEVATLASVTL